MESKRQLAEVRRFSDADVSRFFDRVIELDAVRRDRISETELREIAVELGIPSDLIDQALSELGHGMLAGRSLKNPSAPRRISREALICGALGAGSLLPTALFGVSHLPSLLGVGALAIALGLDSRRVDGVKRYLGRAGGLFSGFVLGGSTLFAFPPDAALGLFVSLPLVSGLLVLRIGQKLRRDGPRRIQPGAKEKMDAGVRSTPLPLMRVGRWVADLFRRGSTLVECGRFVPSPDRLAFGIVARRPCVISEWGLRGTTFGDFRKRFPERGGLMRPLAREPQNPHPQQ